MTSLGFGEGDLVFVQGLKKSNQLNGKTGKVKGVSDNPERLIIKIEDKSYKIRPQNLKLKSVPKKDKYSVDYSRFANLSDSSDDEEGNEANVNKEMSKEYLQNATNMDGNLDEKMKIWMENIQKNGSLNGNTNFSTKLETKENNGLTEEELHIKIGINEFDSQAMQQVKIQNYYGLIFRAAFQGELKFSWAEPPTSGITEKDGQLVVKCIYNNNGTHQPGEPCTPKEIESLGFHEVHWKIDSSEDKTVFKYRGHDYQLDANIPFTSSCFVEEMYCRIVVNDDDELNRWKVRPWTWIMDDPDMFWSLVVNYLVYGRFFGKIDTAQCGVTDVPTLQRFSREVADLMNKGLAKVENLPCMYEKSQATCLDRNSCQFYHEIEEMEI